MTADIEMPLLSSTGWRRWTIDWESHPNNFGSKTGRMLPDAINNEKIRCQEKLFFQKGFNGSCRHKASMAGRGRFKKIKIGTCSKKRYIPL